MRAVVAFVMMGGAGLVGLFSVVISSGCVTHNAYALRDFKENEGESKEHTLREMREQVEDLSFLIKQLTERFEKLSRRLERVEARVGNESDRDTPARSDLERDGEDDYLGKTSRLPYGGKSPSKADRKKMLRKDLKIDDEDDFTPLNVQSSADEKIPPKGFPKGAKSPQTARDDELAYKLAQGHLEDGSVAKARKLFSAISQNGKHTYQAEAFYWLGILAFLQDKTPQQAAELFSKAYQLHEKKNLKNAANMAFRKNILLKLAQSLRAVKNTKAAVVVLEELLALPHNAHFSDQQIQREAQQMLQALTKKDGAQKGASGKVRKKISPRKKVLEQPHEQAPL